MKKGTTFTYIYVVILFLAVSVSDLSAQYFTSMEPGIAAPGEQIILFGSGFDTAKTYTVTIAEISADIQEIQAEFIRFIVPPDATSGPVAIDDGTGSPPLVYEYNLTVTREINASFSAAIPFVTSGYAVGSIYGDSTSSFGPDFPVTIAKGEPTLVMASRLEAESAFMAFATDASSDIELGPKALPSHLFSFSHLFLPLMYQKRS